MKKITIVTLVLASFVLNAQTTSDTFNQNSEENKEKNKTYSTPESVGGSSLIYEKSVKRKADELYNELGYMASTEKYKMLDAAESADRNTMIRMANAYRLNGHTEEAEYWYSHIAQHSESPKDLLHYAQVLQSNGKCEDAIRWYKEYESKADESDLNHREFIEDCDDEIEFMVHSKVKIANLVSVNTSALDFSPVPFGNGIVFTSTRGIDKLSANKDLWTNSHFSDLFYAELKQDGTLGKVEPFEGDINGKYHDGVATFNGGESIMMFTRNSKVKKSKKGLFDLNIYMAYNHENYWTDVKLMPFNGNEFASCHPTLSADGSHLYFSSNRPGGFGGMDIYMSEFNGTGWSGPVNLGPTVNSSGNEVFPYIGSDNILYFSSNGHRGLGGLDIYKAKKIESELEGEEENWNLRENMGLPFNSNKDDFGFYIPPGKKSGYFSSNRLGGVGGDDIYSWTGDLNLDEDMTNRLVCVYDEESSAKVAGAKVIVIELNNEEELEGRSESFNNNGSTEELTKMDKEKIDDSFITNENGQFSFKAKLGKTYKLKIEKEGYEAFESDVSTKELIELNDYCVGIEKRHCQTLIGNVMNSEYKQSIPNVDVTIYNKCTGEESKLKTKKDGSFEWCMPCGCDFVLEATKEKFSKDVKSASSMQVNCDLAEPKQISLELSLISSSIPLVEKTIVNKPVVVPEIKKDEKVNELKNYFLGNSENEFYEGQVIKLQDIYYDYNKWDIREDALDPLNWVMKLMDADPNMEIEMMSHTDSRGSSSFNSKLSSKRANSAMIYLTARGISSHRITSKGYGEEQLAVPCTDGINCSESEHQQNRRTEIRIRKM